jgi:hypothetical protein
VAHASKVIATTGSSVSMRRTGLVAAVDVAGGGIAPAPTAHSHPTIAGRNVNMLTRENMEMIVA